MTESRLLDACKGIKSEYIQKFTIAALGVAPDYFWEVPSSNTGKYHPPDEFCEGGLIMHTLRAVEVIKELCRAFDIKYYEKDTLLSATILHDLCVGGIPPNTWTAEDEPGKMGTSPFHAIYVRHYLKKELSMKLWCGSYDWYAPGDEGNKSVIVESNFEAICKAIEGHYGIWSAVPQVFEDVLDGWSDRKDLLVMLVYIADYISSRRNIIVKLEGEI